jgi:hypothetical protein
MLQTPPPTPAPSTSGAAGTCWYRDPAHRPTLGSCPSACQGPPTHAERVGGGEQHLYCDAHAAWRRAGIRLPTLVRTLSPAEQAATLRR